MNLPFMTINCPQQADIYEKMLEMIRNQMSVFEKEFFWEIILFGSNDHSNTKNNISIRNNQNSFVVFKSTTFEKKTFKVRLGDQVG